MSWLDAYPSSYPGSTNSAIDQQALLDLKRKLKKQIGSFDSLAPIGELRECRGLIRGLANSATGIVKTLVDIKKTRGGSAFKYASEAWLNWSFGVKPMISDVKKLATAIAKFQQRSDRNIVITGNASTDWISGQLGFGLTGARGASVNSRRSSHHTLSYRYTASFNLLLSSANNYGAADHFGFDVPSLVPAAWELMAFSWLLDYFSTMGDFLDDAFSSPSANSVYVVQTRKYTMESDIDQWFVPDSGTIILNQTRGTHHVRYFEFQRTPFSALPRIAVRFRTLDEIGKGGVNKLLNLVSLVGTGFSDRPGLKRR